MRHTILYIFLSFSLLVQADLLSDILRGDFVPQTLTASQQDSILNGNPDTRYRLEHEGENKIFRHSYTANYFIVDTLRKTRHPLCSEPVRDAVMSPNGKYVAYVQQGAIHIHKLEFGTEVAVTPILNEEEGRNEDILEGITDWLYEEEFGTTSVMAFSPDSKMLAFLRTQEQEVPTFAWQTYLSEGKDEPYHIYPEAETLRYTKAGQTNPRVEVCVYDIQTKGTKVMQLSEMDEAYIPRICWKSTTVTTAGKPTTESRLMVLRLNRDQNKMEVIECNPRSTVSNIWYTESYKNGYVDYSLFDEWQWLNDGRVLIVSENSGWRQVYLYSAQGQLVRQLTKDGADITAVYGLDEKNQILYYQQAGTPETRDIYAMNIKKNTVTRLSSEEGWNAMRLSRDYTRAILSYESVNTPIQYTQVKLKSGQAEQKQIVLDNAEIARQWQALNMSEKEFFTFTTPRGDILHGWRLTPSSSTSTLSSSSPFPVVMTQYSGPASQRVVNRWKRTWDYALAEMGYMVVCVDGRGTNARGREWRNATYMNLGEKEAQDQIAAAEYVGTWSNVDKSRIAMVGWSYGGFQVLTTMSTPSHPFKAGIAIAPVTDWRLYDSAYTERYMRRPQVNESGYEQSSLLNKAHLLEGDILLVHGLADDNVHAQNTLLYSEALVAAGKQFEEQLYVDDNHQLRRRANYEHLHRRLLKFLSERL